VHTFFMRFPIDVVFLDRELRTLKVERSLKPWRVAACRRARLVLELPAGEAERREIETGTGLAVDARPL
jgi:hypothetical protein